MTHYQPIIDKINELYITERKKYLILDRQGNYSTFTKNINSPMALNDALIRQHLEGKSTIGVFSGKLLSKFICFDIDMIDKNQTMWLTMNLMRIMNDLGFGDSDYHISSSGNKGIHLLVFSNVPIQLSKFKRLFIMTMQKLQDSLSTASTLHQGNELVLEIKDIANIEFRPSDSQGIKVELGKNFKNKSLNNDCLFLNKETFQPITGYDYFLNIEPCDSELISTIVEDNSIVNEGVSFVKQTIKEPHAQKINRDESETLDFVKDLLVNGMSTSGSRNNSTFKIARYFSFCGYDLEDAIMELKEWMIRQDKKYYKSELSYCLSECERIARSVYEKGYTLVGKVENLKIYKDEMLEIMKIREKNAKLIIFSMLLHSKRFANKSRIFYMTYAQVEESCGLKQLAFSNNLKVLENFNLVEVIERNRKQKGSYIKKPNRYRINIESTNCEEVLEIDNSNGKLDCSDIYYRTVTNLFTDKELRDTNITKRHYNEIKKYRRLIA